MYEQEGGTLLATLPLREKCDLKQTKNNSTKHPLWRIWKCCQHRHKKTEKHWELLNEVKLNSCLVKSTTSIMFLTWINIGEPKTNKHTKRFFWSLIHTYFRKVPHVRIHTANSSSSIKTSLLYRNSTSREHQQSIDYQVAEFWKKKNCLPEQTQAVNIMHPNMTLLTKPTISPQPLQSFYINTQVLHGFIKQALCIGPGFPWNLTAHPPMSIHAPDTH